MLELYIPPKELYDSSTHMFITTNAVTLQLEHSLKSISKWEAKWHKPYISKEGKTKEEWIDYIKCMTLNRGKIDPYVYASITESQNKQIIEYIEDKHSATTFRDDKKNKRASREVITAELVYYWMVAAQIPFECDKWHFNNLMNLIRIHGIKQNASGNKMGQKDIYKQNRALNAARRAKRH